MSSYGHTRVMNSSSPSVSHCCASAGTRRRGTHTTGNGGVGGEGHRGARGWGRQELEAKAHGWAQGNASGGRHAPPGDTSHEPAPCTVDPRGNMPRPSADAQQDAQGLRGPPPQWYGSQDLDASGEPTGPSAPLPLKSSTDGQGPREYLPGGLRPRPLQSLAGADTAGAQ